MAIYTNMAAVESGKHGGCELSNLKSTIIGNIYDVIVRDGSNKAIAVDNGAPVVVGDYTGDGLQTRYAKIAGTKDPIALVSTPAVIKDAFTMVDKDERNFFNKAGQIARAHEVVVDDIFGVYDYQIVSGTVAKDAWVVVDGAGAYKIVSATPVATNGFVGKVHSVAEAIDSKIVRIQVVQNTTIA